MNKLELAETALRKALELDGQSAFVWNNMGLVAFARGRDQEAFLNFQKASELDPKYVEARLNKAVIFMDCGDYKHARTELQRAVDASPGDADADTYVALGVAARGDAKWDESRRAYETALELEPEHAPALYDLGILYMEFDKDPREGTDGRWRHSWRLPTKMIPGARMLAERLNELGAANQKKQGPRPPRPAQPTNSADSRRRRAPRRWEMMMRSGGIFALVSHCWPRRAAPAAVAKSKAPSAPPRLLPPPAGDQDGEASCARPPRFPRMSHPRAASPTPVTTPHRATPSPRTHGRTGGRSAPPAVRRPGSPPASGDGLTAAPTAKTAKTKVYTFGAMDVEGKLKTPQLLYFLNRVKLELEMSAPDHRSFMKELERTAEDPNL